MVMIRSEILIPSLSNSKTAISFLSNIQTSDLKINFVFKKGLETII
jgi:hypothetical protein